MEVLAGMHAGETDRQNSVFCKVSAADGSNAGPLASAAVGRPRLAAQIATVAVCLAAWLTPSSSRQPVLHGEPSGPDRHQTAEIASRIAIQTPFVKRHDRLESHVRRRGLQKVRNPGGL